MAGKFCKVIIKNVDEQLAENLGTDYTPHRVATLRGLYEEYKGKELDVSNYVKAAEELRNLVNELRNKDAKAKRGIFSTRMAFSYKKLKKTMTSTEKRNRVNLISSIITATLNGAEVANPGIPRRKFLEGFIDANGKFVAGEFAFFEDAYNRVTGMRNKAIEDGNTTRAEALNKVLDNWSALTVYARRLLKETEGLKLGLDYEYAATTDPSNFNSNVVSETYDVSESTRESWQEESAKTSSFSTVGTMVRRFLSTIQEVDENGKLVEDDLGIPVYKDAVKAHQELMQFLRGNKSSKTILAALAYRDVNGNIRPTLKAPWLAQVRDALRNDPQLRAQFFVDMTKNFQPYSMLIEDRDMANGQIKQKTKTLNRQNNKFTGNYKVRLRMKKPINSTTIFDNDGNVVWGNVKGLIDEVNKYFEPKQTEEFLGLKVYGGNSNPTFWQRGISRDAQANILKDLCDRIGIDVDYEQLTMLLSNQKELRNFILNLRELIIYGIQGNLKNEEYKTLMEKGTLSKKLSMKALYNKSSKTGSEGNFAEKIRKMLNSLNNSGNPQLESRARYMDRKGKSVDLFSDVAPSYLADRLENIKSYVQANDHDGLKAYIMEHYGCSSMFYDNGVWLNTWLADIIKCCEDKNTPLNRTFVNELTYERFVGDSEQIFENFSSKKHAISMLAFYNSFAELGNSDYAFYPVFILGDSGIQKNIKSRRYNGMNYKEEILNNMILVYRQELRRRALVKAVNEDMSDNNIHLIENLSKTEDRFTTLTFLNPDYVSEDKIKGKYYHLAAKNDVMTEDLVKEAIEAFMSDSVNKFKKELSELGVSDMITVKEVIDTKEGQKVIEKKVPKNFATFKSEAEYNNFLENFYWNTKFATIEQLQLMTIDPGYYMNTEDLQKRYKEIHAPGSILDIDAIDFNGRKYAENPYETALYFNDISVNAEKINAEFMESVAYSQGKRKHPDWTDTNAIIEAGKKTWVYKKYKKNSLTDGQGYRSLSSYRKVLGMAGKWTREMEEVYNMIMEARKTYGRNIPSEILKEIEKKAIIFQPIKPFLFTHEKYPVNTTDSLLIAVQHKYAEAVLIPELLPKNSTIRDMAEYMENEGIDLIGSTKMVKTGIFGQTDIDYKTNDKHEYLDKNGNVIPGGKSNPDFDNIAAEVSNINDFQQQLKKGYVHKLSYSDYRIQTNVPEHIHNSQLFGTQVRKLIMAGVIKYDKNGKEIETDYSHYVGNKAINLGVTVIKKLTGINLIRYYNSLIIANIEESYKDFEKIINDTDKLSLALMQSVINNSRYSMEDLMAFSLDDFNEFVMPLFDGVLEHDAAALCFSTFKKMVNKQLINGGSCVQVSAYGIDNYEKDKSLKYVVDKNKNILWAEAEIPFDFKVIDSNGKEIELQYDDFCDEDGNLLKDKDGNTLIEKQYPGILDIVAYRIPTENCYSMLNLKVVRCSRKSSGGTIKVPAQGTTQAGFDFDIDKLYFMRKEFRLQEMSKETIAEVWEDIYKENPDIRESLSLERLKSVINKGEDKDRLFKYWKEAGLQGTPEETFNQQLLKHPERYIKFDEYDHSKAPEDNKRHCRNNEILNLIRQRLMDPETLAKRITPGGFQGASSAARQMRELEYNGVRSFLDSTGNVDFSKLEEAAKNEATDPRPNLDPTDPMTIIKYNQQNQIADKLIGIFANQNTNHALTSLLKEFRLKVPIAFAGHSYGDGVNSSLIKAPTGVDVDINVAEFLAASVDAVKDPVLNYLNFNTLTADAGALLSRIGYTTTEIGLLFNQPIIKYLCEVCNTKGLSLERGIAFIQEEMAKNGIKYDKITSSKPTADNLAKVIAESSKYDRDNGHNSYYKKNMFSQAPILALFEDINNAASAVSKFVTSTKFTASNAVGSTFGDMYAQQYRIQQYLENVLSETSPIEIKASDDITSPIDNLEYTDSKEYRWRLLNNPLGYEQAMYDANRKCVNSLMKHFPYGQKVYASARDLLNSVCRYGTLDADTINTLHRDILVYLMGREPGSAFDGRNIIGMPDGRSMNVRDFFTKEFAEVLYNQLNSKEGKALKEKYAILQHLSFDSYSNEENDRDIIYTYIDSIGGYDSEIADSIRDSWDELYINEETRTLAIALAVYNFFNYGFNYGNRSFMSLAPTDLRANMMGNKNYTEFLKEILNGEKPSNSEDIVKLFIRNHPDNNRLVWNIHKGDNSYKLFHDKSRIGNTIASEITLTSEEIQSKMDSKGLNLKVQKDASGNVFITSTSALMIDGFLYIADGDGAEFNVFTNGEIRYVRQSILGNKSTGVVSYPTSEEIESAPSSSAGTSMFNELLDNSTNSAGSDGSGSEDAIAKLNALRQQVVESTIDYIVAKYGREREKVVDEDKERINIKFANMDEAELNDTLSQLTEYFRNNPVQTIDEKGDPTISCGS